MVSVGNFATVSNPGGGTTTHTITFPSNLTPGSILCLATRTGTATNLNSVSDGTQSWTVGTHRDQTGRLIVAYFVNNALSTAPTVTAIYSANNSPRLEIFEIVPDDLSGTNISFDKYGQTAAVDGNSATSGTSLDGGTTATLAHPNSISIGVFSAGADQTYSAGTGYTLIGSGNRLGAVYRVVSTTAAVQALATDTASSEWSGITLVFQIAADGGGGINTGTQDSRTGFRDTNNASKTTFNFNVAGFGARDTNAASRTISSGGGSPSTGFRATNSASLAGKTNNASTGFRATNQTSRTIGIGTQASRTGFRDTNQASRSIGAGTQASRMGFTDVNAASKTTFNFNVGGVGFRATNSASLTSGPPTNNSSFGARATNSSSRTIGVGIQRHSIGIRSSNQTTRAISAGANAARTGIRASNVTSRAIAAGAGAGRHGFRATNISFLGGPPPEPVVLVPNFAECETDLTLPASVVWSS